MAPRRGKSAKSGRKTASSSTPKASQPEYTMEQLLTKTQELMDDNDYDTALKFAAKAIELDERNTQALLLAAIIQLEAGDMEPAINCLTRCAEISPDRGFEKYMYLGQFSVELEAIKYFQLGIQAMQRDLDELPTGSAQAVELRRKMAEAYVAMTEIYLTDCCYEEDAEKKCEEFLECAAKVDPECPEVFQTMASVRLSQNRPEDARECVSRSMSIWANKDQNDPSQIPSYDNRLALVRLLLELDQKDEALEMLERLQKEDDENVDMWYLYGWTYHLQSEEAADNEADKNDILGSARECFKKAIKMASIQEYEDEGLVAHATDLIKAINVVVPAGDDEDEDEMNAQADGLNEQEWEDIVSDDDVEMGTQA
ncbi:TPR-like protein [Martensiomyces pterosporus]|nr:TPR-like protein [Martensiomyces pterosporus]